MYKYYEEHWKGYFMSCDFKKHIPEISNDKIC